MPLHSLSESVVSRSRESGCIGVDVGSTAIKLARVACDQGRWELTMARIIPLRNTAKDLDRLLQDDLGDLLRDELHSLKTWLRPSVAACALPMSLVEMRMLELPPGTDEDLRQMIAVELASSDGNPLSSREFDFFAQPPSSQAGLASVTVLSLPTHSAGPRRADFTQRPACRTLDTLPSVLARAVAMVDETAVPVAALDWGFGTPSLTVVQQGQPLYARQLRDCGLGGLVASLRKQWELDDDEIHQLLSLDSRGTSQGGQASLSRLLGQFIEPVLQRTLAEINRTLAFFSQHAESERPASLWLFGGGAMLPGIAGRCSEALGLHARLWRLDPEADSSPADPRHAILGTAMALSATGSL